MSNGRGKTFRFGKMMVNLSSRGVATKDTETGEIKRYPFPWKQTAAQPPRQEPDGYAEDERYDDQGYEQDQYPEDGYDPRYYDEPEYAEYEDENGEYYAPEEDDYEEQPYGGILDAPWLMWAALMLLPPLGVWLLWRRNRFELTTRAAISAASLIWFIVLLIWLFSALNSRGDETQLPPITTPSATINLATPTPSPTPTATAIPQNTPVPQNTPIPQSPDAVVTTTTEPTTWVWSKQGGKWYHLDPTCQGMSGANRISLSAAMNRSQTACPECMPQESNTTPTATPMPADTYYSTPIGTYYHVKPNCSGMSGAQVVSKATALERKQTPCPTCIGSVYMTDGGSWYHSNSSCQGMTKAYMTTVEVATEKGKTACPVCMGGSSGGNTGSNSSSSSVYYYTSGGKYYHSKNNCSGMTGATTGTAAAAEANGKSPCPTCLDGVSANASFYATTGGTYYHTKSNCSGMSNASRISEATAIARNKLPCPTCVGEGSGGTKVNVNTGNTTGNNTTVNTSSTTYYSTPTGSYFHNTPTCSGMANATKVSSREIEERNQEPCPRCIGTSGVYFSTPTGSYYHSKANCSGMKNATIVTLAMINSRGQTACPACLGGSTTNTGSNSTGTAYYWATARGTYYHSKSSCSGMSGATKITASEAEKRGQEACPSCVGSVFGTEDGTYYHKTANCSGMNGATRMTIQAADKAGKTACPVCILGGAAPTATPKPGEDDNDGRLYYYATADGTYYHRESDCSGMKGADKVSEDTASKRGQIPCPKCIGSVYATDNGEFYHMKKNCSGMKNASLVTIDTAELRGQSPCPTCIGSGDSPEDTGDIGNSEYADITVYCTLTGRKYHSDQYCSGMQYAAPVTLAWALNPAYQPCPECGAPLPGTVDEDTTMVFCMLEGTYYHTNKHCSGMRDAADVPLSWALDPDFKPCSECNPPRV